MTEIHVAKLKREYLTVQKLADYLGFSANTIRRYAYAKIIPSINRHNRFHLPSVLRALEERAEQS